MGGERIGIWVGVDGGIRVGIVADSVGEVAAGVGSYKIVGDGVRVAKTVGVIGTVPGVEVGGLGGGVGVGVGGTVEAMIAWPVAWTSTSTLAS